MEMDPVLGAFAIMERHIAALEAPPKEMASRSTTEKSDETARLAAIERKMKELGPLLIQLMEEQSIEKRREQEVVPDETTRRVEPGVPMPWNGRTKKQEQKGASEETTGETNSRDRSEEPEENPRGSIGERPKRGRQAVPRDIGNDRAEEQIGPILRGGIDRGQGQRPSGQGRHQRNVSA